MSLNSVEAESSITYPYIYEPSLSLIHQNERCLIRNQQVLEML